MTIARDRMLQCRRQLDYPFVELTQTRSMSNTDECDARMREPRIKTFLRCHIERAGSFVEKGEARPREQEPREGKPLLFASGEHVRPVEFGIQASELRRQMRQTDRSQDLEQPIIINFAGARILN